MLPPRFLSLDFKEDDAEGIVTKSGHPQAELQTLGLHFVV